MTELTMAGNIYLTYSVKFLKKKSTIVLKIWEIVGLSTYVYAMTLKCLIILEVIWVLPPPGGPKAVKRIMLYILINCWSFLLYHP